MAKGSVVTDLTGSHGASFAGVLAVRLGSWVVPARGRGAADSAGSCAARREAAMARITLGGGQVKHRWRGMVVPCRWHGAWEAVVCTKVGQSARGHRRVVVPRWFQLAEIYEDTGRRCFIRPARSHATMRRDGCWGVAARWDS